MSQLRAQYIYSDEAGTPLYRVLRGESKQFRTERFDNGEWVLNLAENTPRVLYRLPEVRDAVAMGQRVYVVEGEKDADTLASLGLSATTNPFGAGKWTPAFSECLKGADVVVIPDCDAKGREHAAEVARSLADVASSVRLLDLDGPEKSDVTDFIERGGTLKQLVLLADAATLWSGSGVPDAPQIPPDPAVYLDLLTEEELLLRHPPEWLVDGVLPARSLGILYGAPGTGKTFAAIDIAQCIAYGIPWHGKATRQGDVVLIAAEGHAGALGQRAAAWRTYHGRGSSASRVRYHCEPVQLIDRVAVAQLVSTLNRDGAPPALLIVDTFARCTEHADENSSSDMKQAVGAAGRITAETGAAVLLIHHTRKSDNVLRGSSVLAGAADTIIRVVVGTVAGVELQCEKQKEAPHFEPVALQLESFGPSAVLVDRAEDCTAGARTLNDNDRKALAVLPADGMRRAEWLKASGLPEGTFNRVPARLEAAGRVEKRTGRYFPIAGTAAMATTITTSSPPLCPSPSPTRELPLTPTTLVEGVGGGALAAVEEWQADFSSPRIAGTEGQQQRGAA